MAHNIREYRKLLDQLPVGIFLAGADGSIKFVNATLRSWVDLGDREKGAQHKLSTIFPEHAAAILSPSNAGSGPVTTSFDLVKRDGTALPVSVLLTRHKGDQEGEETALFGAVLERHADSGAAAELSDAHRLLGFLKSAPVAIAAIAKDGTITNCNPAFGRFFGTVKSLEHASIFELVEEPMRDRLRQAMEKAAARKVAIPPVDIRAAGEQAQWAAAVHAGSQHRAIQRGRAGFRDRHLRAADAGGTDRPESEDAGDRPACRGYCA